MVVDGGPKHRVMVDLELEVAELSVSPPDREHAVIRFLEEDDGFN